MDGKDEKLAFWLDEEYSWVCSANPEAQVSQSASGKRTTVVE
jgi:hypothetical protein